MAWIQTERNEGGLGDINYPLLSDLKRQTVHAYDVYDENEGQALRGLFIIDKEGIIQHATINNAPFGRSVDETLRTLQAIQYVQSHPDEVCPAGVETRGQINETRRERVQGILFRFVKRK